MFASRPKRADRLRRLRLYRGQHKGQRRDQRGERNLISVPESVRARATGRLATRLNPGQVIECQLY